MSRIERHREICEKLNKIYEQKNNDYGNSFGETYEKLGIISAVTRLSDKYNRICSLATKSEKERMVKDENIKDTLIDLANYAIMTIIEMENEQDKATTDTEQNNGDMGLTFWAKTSPYITTEGE
jgi:hypothetical protein